MKKIISFILSIVLALSLMPSGFSVAAATGNPGLDGISNFLITTDIIDKPVSEETAGIVVTRAEFAEYIAKVMNVQGGSIGQTYFEDVSEDSVINSLTQLSIFKGDGSGYFEPDRAVNMDEVIITLVRVAGLEKKLTNYNIIEYVVEAGRADILDGVEYHTGPASYSEIVALIYNACMTEYCGVTTIFSDGNAMYAMSGKTVIEQYHHLKTARGVVESNHFTSIGAYEARENGVYIDGIFYFSEKIDASNLIGRNVFVYYKQDSGDSFRTLFFLYQETDDDEELIITADKFLSYDSQYEEIKYYDDKDRERTVSLENNFKVVYNGIALDSGIQDAMEIENGKITLLKDRKTDGYSTVLIEEFFTAEVTGVDMENLEIYTSNAKLSKFETTTEKTVIYTLDSGLKTGIYTIRKGDILSLYVSADGELITAYVDQEPFSGTAQSFGSGDSYYDVLTIDGVEYELSNAFIGNRNNIRLGEFCNFRTDAEGRIVAIQRADGETIALGYIYAMGYSDRAFEDVLQVKIFTENGDHIIFECADKINVNGTRLAATGAETALKNIETGTLKRQIIFYGLNKDGKINYIDTAAEKKSDCESDGTLWIDFAKQEATYINNVFFPSNYESGKYKSTAASAYHTVVFSVPDENSDGRSEDMFSVFSFSRDAYFNQVDTYMLEAYKFKTDTAFADVIVHSGAENRVLGPYTDSILVENIVTVRDEEEGSMKAIDGWQSGNRIREYISNNVDISDVSDGDIISVRKNGKGIVDYVLKEFDYSDMSFTIENSAATNAIGNARNQQFGPVLERYCGSSSVNSYILIGNKDTYTEQCGVGIGGTEKILIFDDSRRKDKVYFGTLDEILDYDTVGTDCSFVFLHRRWYDVKNIIFYK